MPDNQPRPPIADAGPNAVALEFKKWRRIATIAGVITLILVIGVTFLTDSDKLKEYSFFVGVVPALLVYFLIQAYGINAAKEKARTKPQ